MESVNHFQNRNQISYSQKYNLLMGETFTKLGRILSQIRLD